MAKKKQILIVGGGFGGVSAALELAGDENYNITLLSDDPELRYYPTLYHTATGGRRAASAIPLDRIFSGKNVTIINGTAATLDKKSRTVTTQSGDSLNYDFLILGLGVITNYFGIPGLKEFAYGIKSQDEVQKFKAHLHQQIIDDHKPDLNYVIVGAGPTGIELAGALPEYLKRIMKLHGVKQKNIHIDLIEASPKLLPRLPKDASRMVKRRLKELGIHIFTSSIVQGESADTLTVSGKPIKSHTVIWTAGMTNNPFFSANNFSLMARGKVAVDVYLRTDENIYVIGDNANTPYSGMAQTAVHDGRFVGKNLKRLAQGHEQLPYKPEKPTTVIPVGSHWAVVVKGSLRLYGVLGWMLREAADFEGFRELEKWDKAFMQYLKEYGIEDNCNVCAIAMNAEA